MPSPGSRLTALLSELKRRRVFRVAAVYAGVAFIIIQIIDGAFAYLPIPDWVGTAIIVVLLVGFPIAVGLAWAFDITEKGVVRTAAEGPEEAKAPPRPFIGNKTLAIVAAVAVAVAVWSWWGRPTDSVPDKSIAVLPFVNFSEEEGDWFSDGITEDIMAHLAKINDLTVIGRTSVMQYKGTTKRLRDIGEDLGVATLLEGSVRRAGGKVRIVSQLIDARTEKHLWAATYDREVDEAEIFALQSDVAGHIATALEATLSPEEKQQIEKRPTANMAAYEAYLKGRYFWNKRTEEGLNKGLEYFKQAIEKDPGYALAYAGVAESYVVLVDWGFFPPKEAHPKARAAAMRALEIESTLSEARTSLAYIKYIYDWNWGEAEKEFKRALELNPNYATGHQWYAEFLTAMGRFDEALEEIRRARELDPLSLIISAIEGMVLYSARQYDLAIEQCRRTLEMDPNFAPAHVYLIWCYAQKGMHEEANAEFQALRELTGRVTSLGYVSAVWLERGEALKVIDELKKLSQQIYIPPGSIASIYARLGEKDQAFQWLEKAYEQRDNLLPHLKIAPSFDPLRSDPRFQDLLRRMNFPE